MRRFLPWLLLVATCGGGDDDDGGTVSRVKGYLQAAPYPKLVLEIDAVPGVTPRATSTEAIRAELTRILAKPGGVTVSQTTSLTSRGADHGWTFAELDELAKSTFDLAVAADTTTMHILFVDGHHADDSAGGKILGVAWANTHLVLFKQTIETACAASAGLNLFKEQMCAAAEQSIWLHELGHVIGLVDNGAPLVRPHMDAAPGAHDASDACVMYWAFEGQGAMDALLTKFLGGDREPLGFDAACLADLAAVREPSRSVQTR
jgi:hypothetical protein